MECRHKSDCCCIEVILATLTFWGYYQILSIGVSLSLYDMFCVYVYVCILYFMYVRYRYNDMRRETGFEIRSMWSNLGE